MEEIAEKINSLIKNSDAYKEYLKYKNIIESDEQLLELKNKLNSMKKKNCKNHDEKLVDEYYKLEKEYNNNILVKKYSESKENLSRILNDICDILSLK